MKHQQAGAVVAASGCSTALLLAVSLSPWMLVVLVVALPFLAEMFVSRSYNVALLFVTPLALLMSQPAYPVPPPGLLAARAGETVLRALVGLSVVVLVPSAAERRAE